jgi:hypothetical protein
MRLRQPRFDSESAQLFGLRESRERLRTKNVHEASVLRFGWYAMEKTLSRNHFKQAKGETTCAISPEYAAQRLRLRVGSVLALVHQRAPS